MPIAGEESGPARLPPFVRAGLATLAGFALLAATNAIGIAASIPWPAGGLRVRALHHLFDAGGVLGLGVVAGACVGAGQAFVARAPSRGARWARAGIALAAFVAVATGIMIDLLGRDLNRQACVVLGGRFERPLMALYVALCGLAVPAAYVVGSELSRYRRLRLLPMAAAIGGIVTNHLILRDDYHGVHGAIAWTAATLFGAAAAPLVASLYVGRVVNLGRGAAVARRRPRARDGLVAGVIALGILGIAVPPSDTVRVELFRAPCAISAWVLARTVWALPGEGEEGALPAEAAGSAWWRERRGMAPIAPTAPPLLGGKAPVVVLLTIDAVRADAIEAPENERSFATLSRLKRQGAYFTRAVAPGTQTAVSLATVFSGRYFSQLVWAPYGKGSMRFPYPAADASVRFPEILANHGVATMSICSINFLAGEYGVARGFAEERVVVTGREHALARSVMEPLLERLERAGDGPLFLFAHLTEPHGPYDRGGRRGTAWARYLAEIRVADRQVERLSRALTRRFGDRGILIVTSDHGEAFGEHGTRQHTKTLYEELLRVPLIIAGPGVVGRRVTARVGLIDLGPTILDLFGIETPATFMGQSLVPLLAGRAAALDRPVLAEGRLRRALYWGELKVIDDPRRKVVEAYDLAADPGEENNLYDSDRARVDPALAALRAFFRVQRAALPGYEPIYKP